MADGSSGSRIPFLGLSERAQKDAETNANVREALEVMAETAGLGPERPAEDGRLGNLLLFAASNLPPTKARFRTLLGAYIGDGRLDDQAKVTAAVKFLKALPAGDSELDTAAFDAACGAGVKVSEEEVRAAVARLVEENRAALVEQRYVFATFPWLNLFKADPRLQWASGKVVKDEIDAQVLALLGPKTEEDDKRIEEAKKAPKAAKKDAGGKAAGSAASGGGAGGSSSSSSSSSAAAGGAAATAASAASAAAESEAAAALAAMRAAFEARDLQSAVNSTRLLEEHRRVTGGRVRTRFPPEPNGYLHIGHAKSMNLNFEGSFRMLGLESPGDTIFRYDDTNPEAESKEYIDNQAENVRFMGWRPCMTTYSSDYFDQLYAFAVQLIKADKAYVCHQTKEDMERSREIAQSHSGDPCSPWRNRPIAESLREFERMRAGCYEEGGATLRMKIDMHSPNPCLWDPVAYRIKYVPHPHIGDAWCIYPSYDFTHCIIDSLEHIDYSLCTLEFEVRRDSYYWLLDALDIWRPRVWEFSRLNITTNVLSKRKILKLVKVGRVRGWDDPRLLTINGLRRRGYTAEAINNFCRDIGVTRTENTIQFHRLEHHIRTDLDVRARRAFGVLNPLKITLTNVDSAESFTIDAPVFPKDESKGTRHLPLCNVLYIDRDDFRFVDDPDFFGLAPGKTVGLRYAGNLTCTEVITHGVTGEVLELRGTYEAVRTSKPKGNLHWVSTPSPAVEPLRAEIRLYDTLFLSADCGAKLANWEDDLNPESEVVIRDALVETPVSEACEPLTHFQLERVGFFVVDKDTAKNPDGTLARLVLNRTVTLKETVGAKSARGGK